MFHAYFNLSLHGEGVSNSFTAAAVTEAGAELCGYAITARREDCCTNAHSPSHWKFQRAAAAESAADRSVEHVESPSMWATLHEGNADGWVAGERKMFELEEPSSLAGFQYRLLLLATGASSPEAPAQCAAGENGTEAWRGRHRCNQHALAWAEWMQWMYRLRAIYMQPIYVEYHVK